MMARSSISPLVNNLAETLGITPGFCSYFVQAISGLQLDTKSIKESGGNVIVTLHYSNQSAKGKFHTQDNGGKTRKKSGNTTTQQQAFPDTQKRKKKSPSRRRRDRERLHRFLERKKCQKQISSVKPVTLISDHSATVSHVQPLVVATSPPPELPTESSGDDSWITVSEVELPP